MFCPKCSQQQISEDIKFCSRCGLPLGVVSEVVGQGGYLPQLAELANQKKTIFNKKNGVVFSIFWCIFFIFLAIVFDGIFNVNRLGGLFVAKGVFGGILILLVSLAYFPSSKPKAVELPSMPTPKNLYGQAQGALPPQQSQLVSSYVPATGGWRAPETGEFAHPGSVTDTTTKLLKHDE